jgi:uncharacterized circularly permuted ATP-grasp superfamily protein
MRNALAPILEQLDRRIVSDPSLTAARLTQLLESQRELGLLQGDRPTCPFLRPHVISRSQYDAICNVAETIAGAFEKVAARALTDPEFASRLRLTPVELNVARIDPGYERLCITSRLDAYFSKSGFKFLEYNAETPAGVGDQMQLEKLLLGLKHNEDLLERHSHWRPEPHRRLLTALIAAYRETGGQQEYPSIAIVDWAGVATQSEFFVLKEFFESKGHPTVVADPRELTYEGKRLRTGKFGIDIVYKRVVIHEFLEMLGEEHPLIEAYAAGAVCMANSFRTKIAHKKAGFSILSDPQFEHLFTSEEVEAMRRHIPWTRNVAPGPTIYEGDEYDLFSLMRSERKQLVLKPNDDYGGHGVFIGWDLSTNEWEQAIKLAMQRPYVVQERVPVEKHHLPTFGEGVSREEMFVDFNPFLFHNKAEGALIRASPSAVVNVTSGGGQTALLVLEDL